MLNVDQRTLLFNRVADNWRPLFAIADAVGEPWAALARDAAKSARKGADDQSLRVLLLSDVRDVFWAKNTDRLRSAELAEALGEIKAVVAAGLRVAGVKVSAQGDIEVVTGSAGQDSGKSENDWDRALTRDAH